MPLEMRPGVTIRRPRREVAAVMLDPRHETSWLETFARVAEDDHDPPLRLVRFLLRPRPVALRVTGHDAERFVEWQAEEPWPIFIRQDMESIPEGTLVRIRLRVQLSGLARLLKPLVARRLRRSLIADLETLKGLVENSPHRGMAAARPATAVEADPPAAAAQPPRAGDAPGDVAPPAGAAVPGTPAAAVPAAATQAASMAATPAVMPAPATRPGSIAMPAGAVSAPGGTVSVPAGSTPAPAGSTSVPAGSTSAPAGSTSAPAGDALNAAPSTVKVDTTLRPPAWRTKATKVNW